MQTPRRQLYRNSYRNELDDPANSTEGINQDADASNTVDPATPEEKVWQKRYGDLRSHTSSLTERIKSLEDQLRAAQKQEIKIPSSQEEISDFARRYPDIYRHIRSIAMQELLQQKEDLTSETHRVQQDLDKVTRELGLKKILVVHKDFETLKDSDSFHEWASVQPKEIQDWLYDSVDPELCIKAIDLYKAEVGFKQAKQSKPKQGADMQVNTRTAPELPDSNNKRVWKASDIAKLHPKMYEQLEDEIELAREEGRIDLNA